jgi:hypothetical protein
MCDDIIKALKIVKLIEDALKDMRFTDCKAMSYTIADPLVVASEIRAFFPKKALYFAIHLTTYQETIEVKIYSYSQLRDPNCCLIVPAGGTTYSDFTKQGYFYCCALHGTNTANISNYCLTVIRQFMACNALSKFADEFDQTILLQPPDIRSVYAEACKNAREGDY